MGMAKYVVSQSGSYLSSESILSFAHGARWLAVDELVIAAGTVTRNWLVSVGRMG